MKTFKCKIVGTSPLLMNKPSQYGFDTAIKVKFPQAPAKEAEKEALEKMYSIEGKPAQPAEHIHASLVNAGKELKVKGMARSTYSKIFSSMIEIRPDHLLHEKTAFTIFPKLARNPNTGGRQMVYRPMLNEWELHFELTAEDEIPDEVIKEGLERAGKYQGIGDWRPGKNDSKIKGGKFGKFMVTRFEKVDVE